MYSYFNISADEHYQGHVDTLEVVRHLRSISGLEEKSPTRFEFSEHGQWFLVLLLVCDRHGNYSSTELTPDRINLIEVTSGLENGKAFEFAQKLAERLGWAVVEVTPR